MVIDLGAVQSVDTLFLGYVVAAGLPAVQVAASLDGGVYTPLAQPLAAAPSDGAPYQHYVLSLSVPIAARFWQFTLALGIGGYAGVLALGRALVSANGHDWGGGRTIGDSSVVTRLLGGGLGVDDGATFGGYGWTFSDLTDAEIAALFALARDRGLRRPLIVIEDPDVSSGLNERLHWSVFTKFDAYERLAPGMTKWALKVEDWL